MNFDNIRILQIISLVFFFLLLIGYWGWCHSIAYPIVLEKNSRKGASWLYLPKKWMGTYKHVISLLTSLYLLILISVGSCAILFYTLPFPVYYWGIGTIIMSILIIVAHFLWSSIRYQQQLDSYFFIQNQIIKNTAKQAQSLSEPEIERLASFQHKSLLQKADNNHQLKSAMTQQSILSKKRVH